MRSCSNTDTDTSSETIILDHFMTAVSIVHFTDACLVAKPLNRSEAKGDLVMIQTVLFFKCKLVCYPVLARYWSLSLKGHLQPHFK